MLYFNLLNKCKSVSIAYYYALSTAKSSKAAI